MVSEIIRKDWEPHLKYSLGVAGILSIEDGSGLASYLLADVVSPYSA